MTSVGLGVLLFAGFVAYISRSIPHPFAAEFPKTITLNPNAIEAKAALVYDPAEHRILFQKNAATSLPLASLTKLMSAQAVLNKIPDTRSVTITSEDLKPEGDWGFAVGDIVKISDLIKMSLIASSNDAMAAAAASLGDEYLNEMNSTAGHLGLSNTYFLNPTGLDLSEDTAGAYGSAYLLWHARIAAGEASAHLGSGSPRVTRR